jgi:hypothetical protein
MTRRNIMKKSFSIGLLCLGFALVWSSTRSVLGAPQAICTSAGTGNWTAITWTGCAAGPQAGDNVVIAAGNIVTLNANPPTLASLAVNNTGTLTFNNAANRTLTVSGAVTIDGGGTINIATTAGATHSFNVAGDFTNNGTFNALGGGSRFINTTFNGNGLQTISGTGTTTFNNLTVNSGSRVVFPATNLPTVNGTMTVSAGGAVQQTQTVNNGTVNFLQISTNKYLGVDLITPNNLGSTTVVITTTVNGGCTSTGTGSPVYATRCYSITPTAANLPATVRLYALTTELNTITLANLRVYRYTGGAWQQLTPNGSPTASGNYSYATADTAGFSAFLLGGLAAPTAVTLSSLTVQSQPMLWLFPFGLALLAGAVVLFGRRRTH